MAHIVRPCGLLLLLFAGSSCFGQADSARSRRPDTLKATIPVDSLSKVASPNLAARSKIDSVMRHHSPKKAAIRSALLPGLGQIYNKRYWKLPIVYGALGVTAGIFFYNLGTYNDLRFAYKAKVAAMSGDSSLLPQANQQYIQLDAGALRTYRDQFRQNIDYSALFFLLFWGLNVVDAAVDAHLKSFDVSPDLSLKFKFGASELARTSGFSIILAFK